MDESIEGLKVKVDTNIWKHNEWLCTLVYFYTYSNHRAHVSTHSFASFEAAKDFGREIEKDNDDLLTYDISQMKGHNND